MSQKRDNVPWGAGQEAPSATKQKTENGEGPTSAWRSSTACRATSKAAGSSTVRILIAQEKVGRSSTDGMDRERRTEEVH